MSCLHFTHLIWSSFPAAKEWKWKACLVYESISVSQVHLIFGTQRVHH
jgi:hypothetical protein